MTKVALRHRAAALEAIALGALVLAVRLAYLNSATPEFDEFYHILAARSWLADGTLKVGDGVYTRTSLYTILVAGSMRLFGDSLAAARLPAAIAGTLWVVAVFLWTRRVAGPAAAWAAALLFGLDPGAIHLSQLARFYALHGLAVWIGATTAYALVEQELTGRRATIGAGVIALAWLLALHLQVTTIIGIVAVGAWAAWKLAPRAISALSSRPRLRWAALAALGLLMLGGLYAFATGEVGLLWHRYNTYPVWAEPSAEEAGWYVRWLRRRYPILWALSPVAAVVALVRFRRPASFAITVCVISFVLQSFGATKHERYLYYAIPFFFAVWGFALAEALRLLRGAVDALLDSTRGFREHPRLRSAATWAALAAMFLFAYRRNPATDLTRDILYPGKAERPYAQPDYARAAPTLRAFADSADVVISTAIVKTMYYLGRGDFALSRTQLGDLGPGLELPPEFSVDFRTGRPAMSTAESLERIMACYATGVVLVEKKHWRTAYVMPGTTADFLETHLEEVALKPDWGLKAFRWRRTTPAAGVVCPPTVARSGGRAAQWLIERDK